MLRTTSAPESSRQCFRLAGGWEEHRGTVAKEILVSWMIIKTHASDLKRSKNRGTCNGACHPDGPLRCHVLTTTGGEQTNPGIEFHLLNTKFRSSKSQMATYLAMAL